MVINPAFAQVDEPVGRIFAILAGYRERILQTECRYGCPLGRLALEIDPENRPAHKLIAENFQGWIEAIRECVDAVETPAGDRRAEPRDVCAGGDGRRSDALALVWLGGTFRSHDRAIAGALQSPYVGPVAGRRAGLQTGFLFENGVSLN